MGTVPVSFARSMSSVPLDFVGVFFFGIELARCAAQFFAARRGPG
jgi:hypothetical protein